jgi:hypothetical protein
MSRALHRLAAACAAVLFVLLCDLAVAARARPSGA